MTRGPPSEGPLEIDTDVILGGEKMWQPFMFGTTQEIEKKLKKSHLLLVLHIIPFLFLFMHCKT